MDVDVDVDVEEMWRRERGLGWERVLKYASYVACFLIGKSVILYREKGSKVSG